MTKDEFKEKIIDLLDQDSGVRNVVLNGCINAMSSDMAKGRFLNAAENDYVLPKAVLTAVLKELAWQYEPFDKSARKIVVQLKPFIKL